MKNSNKKAQKIFAKYIILIMIVAPILYPFVWDMVTYAVSPEWEAIWLTWSDDPSTTITINWRWGYEGNAYITYWNSTTILTVNFVAKKVNHIIIRGLSPDTVYHYQIGIYTLGVPKSWSQVLEFHTAPREALPFTVLVQTDTHAPGYGSFPTFISRIKNEVFNFTIHCGDIVDRSYPQFWANFFEGEKDVLENHVIMPVMGNHEYYGDSQAFVSYFLLPNNSYWYAYRYSNVLFIALHVADPRHFVFPDEEKDMLIKMVSKAKSEGLWSVVYFHIPPLNIFPFETNPKIYNDLFELLNETKPDLVLSGHAHAYARKNLWGVTYIIVGSAGALENPWIYNEQYPDAYSFENGYLLLKFDGNRLLGLYKNLRGKTIDSFVLSR